MHIVQITPGAGKMFCGGCLRDNALVAALRQIGHTVTMVPLYLPVTLDEADQSTGIPIFFSGINVYLEQKFPLFQRAPNWLRQILASPRLLALAAGSAAKTRPADVGDLMISMLRGEEGNQARELDELLSWLGTQEKPSVISLSNALLVGFARKMKSALRVPVVCSLQGEDFFLDALPAPIRHQAWQVLGERAAEVDLFIAPSRYFADLMGRRLHLPSAKIKVMANGIQLEGFRATPNVERPTPGFPTVGFFARMCPEKGLDKLIDAFLQLRQRPGLSEVRLKIGGSFGPGDEVFVQQQKTKLKNAGAWAHVAFHPNLSRNEKLAFLQSLSVFSVPATYGEAFGLYVIEALAAGVPVVQPRHAAFPEVIAQTGGGLLYEPNDAAAWADAVASLLWHPEKAGALGAAGQKAVFEKFHAQQMAGDFAQACADLSNRKS